MSFEASFTATSARYLRDTYMQRIAAAIELMTPQDLWRRTHDGTNSVANLLLHLEGNVRQWILAGLGGAEDHRDRGAEFAARGGLDAPGLLAPLRETVAAAAALIEDLDSKALARRFTVSTNVSRKPVHRETLLNRMNRQSVQTNRPATSAGLVVDSAGLQAARRGTTG